MSHNLCEKHQTYALPGNEDFLFAAGTTQMSSLELPRASRFVAAGGKRAFTSISGNSNLPSINVQPLSAAAAVAQRWLRNTAIH